MKKSTPRIKKCRIRNFHARTTADHFIDAQLNGDSIASIRSSPSLTDRALFKKEREIQTTIYHIVGSGYSQEAESQYFSPWNDARHTVVSEKPQKDRFQVEERIPDPKISIVIMCSTVRSGDFEFPVDVRSANATKHSLSCSALKNEAN